jgi:two-component system sensor histidine kinase KdpD
VWVDRELLVRVLENLIGNALKFSPLDAPVVVEWQDADHLSAVVRVRDTGSGVPDAYKAVVFDRFQVARHHDRSVRQTGLGLSFCRHALAAHGGTIWVEDNVPHGAVFAFTIPLALDNPAM